MTDGHANVARDGEGGRSKALEEALAAGKAPIAARVAALAIDTSPRCGCATPRRCLKIAEAMGADYVKLPVADSARVNAAVRIARGV